MAEEIRVGIPSFQSIGRKITAKFVLKWGLFSLLLLIMVLMVYELIVDLKEIHEIEDEILKHEKNAEDDIRGWKLTVWSQTWLYFSFTLLAIYATVKEKYGLLLSFAVVSLVIMVIFIFDYQGPLDLMLDGTISILSLVTAVYYKYEQNIPWNPL